MARKALESLAEETAGGELRLDPFRLPVRYSAAGLAVHLDRDRAVVKGRLPSGLPVVADIAVSAFKGIVARLVPVGQDGALRVSLELLHADPALTLPLAIAEDPGDLAADWQAWGRVLSLPLLLATPDGRISEAAPGGRVERAPPSPRRVRRFLAYRRPRFLKRRKTGQAGPAERVVGREIIARR